jgi:hypothetical protein
MEKGSLKVGLKDERGFVLTKDLGFTVEEESRVLSFDFYNSPDPAIGPALLFGDQVFLLKFWTKQNLEQGLRLLEGSIKAELERRGNGTK